MNKRNLIIILVLLLALIGGGYWYYSNFGTNLGRASNYSTPPPQEVSQGTAIYNLKQALPLSSSGFVIESYDFKTGHFIVKSLYANNDLQKAFDTWYRVSQYSSIPKSMFDLQ
ncbi:MAG: hypothetical protein KGJ07_06920 [Patescibacteria group bacterium]|nr:hypothetical protein [Patescibacteria group bacterium]